MKTRLPQRKWHILIRDDGPMVNANGSPSYRVVEIELTDEQLGKLALEQTWTQGVNEFYEVIDRVVINPTEAKP